MDDFERSMTIVLQREGGHLAAEEATKQGDPGGETKRGTSKRPYPELDIGSLTKEQAKEIYHRDYWLPIQADKMTWPLSLFVFDSAVNQGTHAAIRMMQITLGTNDDGVIGPQTITLLSKARQWHAAKFLALRARRYVATSNFDKFGEGWLIRLFTVAMESWAHE